MADCGASSRLPSFSTTCRFRTTAAQGHLPERCGRHRPDGLFFTLKALSALLPDYGMDFVCEVAANWKLIFADYGFWASAPPEQQGLASEDARRTLEAITKAWRRPHLSLPTGEFLP